MDVLPNGPDLMRSGNVFGNGGLSQAAASAKQLLDSTMSQNAADPSMQAPTEVFKAPGLPRAGMAFRGGARSVASAPPSGNAPANDGPATGIDGLDNMAALGATPPTAFADPTKDGVNGTIHPSFFQHGGLGRKIAGVLGDGLMDYAAANGDPMATMRLRQRGADQDAQRQLALWQAQENVRRQQQLQDRDYEDDQKPRYFSSAPGVDYNRYDPSSGQTQNLYQSPTAAQDYAASFGDPGSAGYNNALNNFYLKSWSPDAINAREQYDDHRTGNKIDVRQSPTYRDTHSAPPSYRDLHPHTPTVRQPTTSNVVAGVLQKGANGQPLNAQEQQIFGSYVNGRRGGHTAAGGGVAEGTIIKNPQTGARMKMQGGKWVAI